jgi:hypothetical protein
LPTKLAITIRNIDSLSNAVNIAIIKQFREYMEDNGASERHQNNNLKAIVAFARFLGASVNFTDAISFSLGVINHKNLY